MFWLKRPFLGHLPAGHVWVVNHNFCCCCCYSVAWWGCWRCWPWEPGNILNGSSTSAFHDLFIPSGWWFQTFLLFSIIYGIILPIDFHIFQDGSNHQPAIFFWQSPIISPTGLQPAEFADPRVLLQPNRFVHRLRPLDWREEDREDRPGQDWPVPCWDKIFTVQFTSYFYGYGDGVMTFHRFFHL